MTWTGDAKYTITYVSGDGVSYTCDIHKKAYSGAATAFRVEGPAVKPIWQADYPKLPWGAMRGTCNVHLKGETTILDAIEGADHDEYRLHFYNPSLSYFYGPVSVDYSTRSRSADGNESAILRATDGLERLASIPWDNAGVAYTGRENILQSVFVNGLNKLDLGLGFKVSVNWYPDSALLATDDPFSDNAAGSATEGIRHDREDFVAQILRSKGADPDGSEVQVYVWDVIEYWLKAFQCRLTNDGEYWWIDQRAEKLAATRRIWIYDEAGANQTTGTPNHAITFDGTAANLDDGSAQYRNHFLERDAGDAYSGAVVRYKPSPIELVTNKDLSEWSAGLPVDWSKTAGAVVTRSSIGKQNAIAIEVATPDHPGYDDNVTGDGANTSDVEYVEYVTTTAFNPTIGDGFQIKGVVRYRQTTAALSTNPGFPTGNVMYWAHVQVEHETGWFLQQDGTWAETETKLRIDVPVIKGDFRPVEWSFYGEWADDLTLSQVYVRLYQGTNRENNNGGGNIDRVDTIEWGPIELDYLPQDEAPVQERTTRVTIDGTDQKRELPPVTFLQSDGPDAGTSSRLTVESTDIDTESWTKSGGASGGVSHAKFWCQEFLKQFGTAPAFRRYDVQYWKGETGSKTAIPLRPFNSWVDGSFKGDLSRLEWDTALGRQKLHCLELLQGSPATTDDERDELTPIVPVKPGDDTGDEIDDLPAGVALAWNWIFDEVDLLWDLAVTWTTKDRTRSIRWAFGTTDAEPVDWSSEQIEVKDASQQSGTFTITNIAHGVTYYLFVKGYTGTNGDGIEGQTVRVPLNPPINPRFAGPDCLLSGPLEAIYTMSGQGTLDVLVNGIQTLSENPNGSLEGDIADWTWSTAGLSKTSTGTTEYVSLPVDLLGPISPFRFMVFIQFRADSADEIGLLKITAGSQTVLDLKRLTTNVVRLSVTDEAAATTNIDHSVLVADDTWAGVAFQVIRAGSTYSAATLHVLNSENGVDIAGQVFVADVSLDFTSIKLAYNNEVTIRLNHWLGNVAFGESQFNAEAICARQFTVDSGVDPEEVVVPTGAIVLRTDDGIEVYDSAGTVHYDWADANGPNGKYCRPAVWQSKAFYAAEAVLRSGDIEDGANQASEDDFGAGNDIKGLWTANDGRLYASISDEAGTNDFGYYSGTPGSLTWNSLTTSLDIGDFVVYAAVPYGIVIYQDISDSEIRMVRLDTFAEIDATSAEANSAGVVFVREEQAVYRMTTGADVYRYFVGNVPLLDTTKTEMVEGSGFTTPRPSTLCIDRALGALYLVATDTNDKVFVGQYDIQGQTSASFAALLTAGATVRGACLAALSLNPTLAAPVLTVGTETSTTVPLTWADITGESSYVLQRAPDVSGSPGTWVQIATPAGGATSYTDTGLTPETSYWYQLRGQSGINPGPWSDAVMATTEVTVVYAFIAAVGPVDRIDVLANGSLFDSYETPVDFGGVSARQTVAYHSGIDRVLYLAGTKLRSVQWDGTSWANDTEAWDFGAQSPLALWVLSNGAVWVYGASGSPFAGKRWASADINTDLAWDTPSFDYGNSGLFVAHAVMEGSNEGWVGIVASDGDLYRRLVYNGAGASEFKDETGVMRKCFMDVAGDRHFYYHVVTGTDNDLISVMADTASAADTTVLTMTAGEGGDNPDSVLVYESPWLYFGAGGANRLIRRCKDDGSDSEQFYDAGSGYAVTGLAFYELAI